MRYIGLGGGYDGVRLSIEVLPVQLLIVEAMKGTLAKLQGIKTEAKLLLLIEIKKELNK